MKMAHSYSVQGMTCNNCVRHVESALSNVAGVSSVKADLTSGKATVEMERPVGLDALNDALADTKYRLTNQQTASPAAATPASEGKLRDFLPLIAVFTLILVYTGGVLVWLGEWDWMDAMRHFEGAFFITFGGFKLLNWRGFVDAYSTYDILAARSRLYGYAYPLIELALGIAYLTSFHLLVTSALTFALMLIGSIGVARALAKKSRIPCACLGVVFKVPMTKVTLFEDLLMGGMALAMIVGLLLT